MGSPPSDAFAVSLMTDTPTMSAPEPGAALLLDVRAVARLLDCSSRHVYRLADAGKMPAPIKLGALVRWRRQDIDAWLAGGCKPVRMTGRGGRQ
jgi:excisionase family DNA binding protein